MYELHFIAKSHDSLLSLVKHKIGFGSHGPDRIKPCTVDFLKYFSLKNSQEAKSESHNEAPAQCIFGSHSLLHSTVFLLPAYTSAPCPPASVLLFFGSRLSCSNKVLSLWFTVALSFHLMLYCVIFLVCHCFCH